MYLEAMLRTVIAGAVVATLNTSGFAQNNATSSAPPSEQVLWEHNGSTVYLIAQGRSRKFYYQEPRQGMLMAGAKPGSLLFEGEALGNRYEGTAYRFHSRCGQTPYPVSGPILDDYRRVELRGRIPLLDANCKIVRYQDDLLIFQLIEPTPLGNAPPGRDTESTTQFPIIQAHSGWVTFKNIEEKDGFKIFRRYGYMGDVANPLPNLILFNCSKNVTKAASHLTFILPEIFKPKSFPRSAWIPKIQLRVLIDDKLSVLMPGEYHGGEIYIDLNTETEENFHKLMLADKLAIGFGDKNDVIQFQFTEKVDGFFSDVMHDLKFEKLGAMTHYSRAGIGSVTESCHAYQQSVAEQQTSERRDHPQTKDTMDQGITTVPMQNLGGTYAVPVLINNAITLDFIVDSGASDVNIPADVVLTLFRTGSLTDADFLGTKTYVLADGSKIPSEIFRIKSLKIGNRVLNDVAGSVGSVKGSLLLGQSFLRRFKSWSVDNNEHVLILND